MARRKSIVHKSNTQPFLAKWQQKQPFSMHMKGAKASHTRTQQNLPKTSTHPEHPARKCFQFKKGWPQKKTTQHILNSKNPFFLRSLRRLRVLQSLEMRPLTVFTDASNWIAHLFIGWFFASALGSNRFYIIIDHEAHCRIVPWNPELLFIMTPQILPSCKRELEFRRKRKY